MNAVNFGYINILTNFCLKDCQKITDSINDNDFGDFDGDDGDDGDDADEVKIIETPKLLTDMCSIK